MKDAIYRESSLALDTLVDPIQSEVSGSRKTNTHGNKKESKVENHSENNFCSIYVSQYRINKEVGISSKLLQILEDCQLYYRHKPSDGNALTLHSPESQLGNIKDNELIQRISSEVTELLAENITINHDIALIMLIGEKMHHNVNSIERAARVLAEKEINIEIIHMNQQSSQISLVFGVKAYEEKTAIEALYNEFFASVPV
ncbi:ACT domain-containing protein [Aquibacillus sediminis]|uniref:ACT domain-containing protein n=1 Tax=Aquibacillus sediminis TaxID=2574734 RepID=UPI001109FA7B|nr:hypothetical protein [Aquibacillus sediminis]